MPRDTSGLIPFKKGQTGNPNGRPVLSKDLRDARTMNREVMIELMNNYVSMTKAELSKVEADKSTKYMDLIVISILKKARANGDYSRLKFFLDYLCGPNTVKIEANINMHQAIVQLIEDKEKEDGTGK